MMKKFFTVVILAFVSFNLWAVTSPSKEIKVGVLKFGTANWELKTTMDNGIDAKHNFKLNVVGLADKKANIAAFLGIIINMGKPAVAFGSDPMAIAINMLEIFVAFLQGYIFSLLSSIFIGMAVMEHEHH